MYFCDSLIENWQQAGLHVAEWGSSSCAYEVRRGIDMAAFGDDLAHRIKPRVVCEEPRHVFFIRTIVPVSGLMVLYDGLECADIAPMRDFAF